MARIFIGIGSNEGDRLAAISRAVHDLAASPGIRVLQLAPIIETEPVGGPPQGRYLNTVAELDTAAGPQVLFATLKAIERRLGRPSGCAVGTSSPTPPVGGVPQLGREPAPARNLPRIIDLDLLLYGDLIVEEPGLVVPHPRMHERAFVLEPLAQIAPDIIHPLLHRSMAELLERLSVNASRESQHSR